MGQNKHFDVLLERVQRATTHRDEMWHIASEHLKAHPVVKHIDRRPNEQIIMVESTHPFPPALSVLFGEWLYNLRAALDGLFYELVVYDTATDPPPNAGRLSYPMTTSPASFHERIPSALSERMREFIEATQPYHSTGGHLGSALWWINELARLDRHRRGRSLTWRVIELEVNGPSLAIDASRTRICDQFAAFIRDDEQLELARIAIKPGFTPQRDDGIDVSWTIQFDVPEWVQRSVRSYGAWSMDDRMANAELTVHETVQFFRRHLFDI